jgi:hypothetical protein
MLIWQNGTLYQLQPIISNPMKSVNQPVIGCSLAVVVAAAVVLINFVKRYHAEYGLQPASLCG